MAASSIIIGNESRESAKKRRRDEYKQDLELQIKERHAARQRERLQDMSVNASGYLDPEKSPERFKPLGGAHWTEQRERRTDRVQPYHTLFLYDRSNMSPSLVPVNSAVDQAYSFLGARDLGDGGGKGTSLVMPITLPHSDNRPVVIKGDSGGDGYHGPRYNPFQVKTDNSSDYRSLLLVAQAEKDRMRRDNDEFQRRLRQDLEEERRKLNTQEAEARRRMEELRREAEQRLKDAEKKRKEEVERVKKETVVIKTNTEIVPRPQSKQTMLYYDMDDYRLQLIEERKKIEQLLKAGKPVNDAWDLKVVHKPPLNLPPTPRSADRANRDNVDVFNNLKHRNINNDFRYVYPDVPVTNKRLEQQQEALIRHQESTLREQSTIRPQPIPSKSPRRAITRPSWMDGDITPFPHVLRKRDRIYTSFSDSDFEMTERKNHDKEKHTDPTEESTVLDELKLRHHRSSSTETLADDTWLRPSSTADV